MEQKNKLEKFPQSKNEGTLNKYYHDDCELCPGRAVYLGKRPKRLTQRLRQPELLKQIYLGQPSQTNKFKTVTQNNGNWISFSPLIARGVWLER